MLRVPSEIIQTQILSHLSHDDIINYCNSHPYFRILCQDDTFWIHKLNQDFGTHTGHTPSQYVTLYRNHDEAWHLTYKRWEQNFTKDTSLDPDITMWKLDHIPYNEHQLLRLFNLAIEHDDLNVLQKIHTINPKISNYSHITIQIPYIIQHSKLCTVQWFYNIYNYTIPDIIEWTLEYGRTDILDWLFEEYGYVIDNQMFQTMLEHTSPQHIILILHWLMLHNTLPSIDDVLHVIDVTQDLDIITWVLEQGYKLTSFTLNDMVGAYNVKVIEGLYNRGWYKPNQESANYAAKHGNTKVVRWLEQHGIRPTNTFQPIRQSHLPSNLRVELPVHNTHSGLNSGAQVPTHNQGRRVEPIVQLPKYNTRSSGLNSIAQIPSIDSQSQLSTDIGSSVSNPITQVFSTIQQPILSNIVTKPDNPNKVLNPITRHWITRGGEIYNKLVKQGIIIP